MCFNDILGLIGLIHILLLLASVIRQSGNACQHDGNTDLCSCVITVCLNHTLGYIGLIHIMTVLMMEIIISAVLCHNSVFQLYPGVHWVNTYYDCSDDGNNDLCSCVITVCFNYILGFIGLMHRYLVTDMYYRLH